MCVSVCVCVRRVMREADRGLGVCGSKFERVGGVVDERRVG